MTREEACVLARAKQTSLRTARVKQLADLVADGLTIRAAAATMGIAESTAWNYWADVRSSMEFAA